MSPPLTLMLDKKKTMLSMLSLYITGIGVPILLAYVYGVVPVSLCRSGGCGVTTTNSGVRFEFDDENDVTVGVSGPYAGTSYVLTKK